MNLCTINIFIYAHSPALRAAAIEKPVNVQHAYQIAYPPFDNQRSALLTKCFLIRFLTFLYSFVLASRIFVKRLEFDLIDLGKYFKNNLFLSVLLIS